MSRTLNRSVGDAAAYQPPPADAPPSVVHLLYSGSWGGKERAAAALMRAQRERHPGRRVAALFAGARGHVGEELARDGITVLEASCPRAWEVWRAPGLARLVDGWDIAQHYGEFPPYLASAAFARHARHVFVLRGGLTWHRGALLQAARRRLNDCLIRRMHALAGNCAFAQAHLAARLEIRRDAVACVPNGFDVPVVDRVAAREHVRREFGLSPDERVVVVSGRLSPQKRPYLALKCAREAARLAPEVRLALLFLGDGGERARLEALLRGESPPNLRVILAGWRADADQCTAGADAVLFTGRLDCFANSVAEAVAHGVPVVAFRDGGGAVEHIRTGVDGCLVSDSGDAGRCLAGLIRRPPATAAPPSNGRANRHSRFDMAARYDLLYAMTLERSVPRTSAA